MQIILSILLGLVALAGIVYMFFGGFPWKSKKTKDFKLDLKLLSEPKRVRFMDCDREHEAWMLGTYSDGKIQCSENKTLETMRFAQNWVISKKQLL